MNAGNVVTRLLVGYDIDTDWADDEDCLNQHEYKGAVFFDLANLGKVNASSATLRFGISAHYYKPAKYIATNEIRYCVEELGLASDNNWMVTNIYNLLMGDSPLPSHSYRSLNIWQSEVDVTSAVNAWIKAPEINHGFVFSSPNWDFYNGNGEFACWLYLNDIELEIDYFGIN